jgi:hypothetical protein
MMGKRDGTKDYKHQGTTRTLEGNKEISHRSWYRRIRIGRRGAQEGVAEEMMTFSGSKKRLRKAIDSFHETESQHASHEANR